MNICSNFAVNHSKLYNFKPSFVSNISFRGEQDSVSFSKKQEEKSEIAKKAQAFGLDLYALLKNDKLSHRTIFEAADVPVLKIDTIKNLSKIMPEFDTSLFLAYTLPSYNQDCRLQNITLYTPSKIDNIKAIGSIAHEYTHCLQRYNDDTYMGLADVTGRDLYKTRALNSLAGMIFNKIEADLKLKYVMEKAHDAINNGEDEMNALYNAFECKDEKEFRKNVKRYFNAAYDDKLSKFKSDPEVKKYLPFLDDPLKLKKVIRQQCAKRAQMEKEAYIVQRDVIGQIDKNELSTENIVNPIFYEAIEQSLS